MITSMELGESRAKNDRRPVFRAVGHDMEADVVGLKESALHPVSITERVGMSVL